MPSLPTPKTITGSEVGLKTDLGLKTGLTTVFRGLGFRFDGLGFGLNRSCESNSNSNSANSVLFAKFKKLVIKSSNSVWQILCEFVLELELK